MPLIAQIRAFVASAYGIVILALLAALAIQTARIEGFKVWPIHVAGLKAELSQEREGRLADRQAYEAAQKDAKAKNIAEVQRINTESQRKTDAIKSQYERDLARLRAGGLRPEYTAPPGSPGKPQAGTVPGATCRADAENVCVPRSVLLRAGEIELKANSLIDWINVQLGVKR